jgi:hypothetical protein
VLTLRLTHKVMRPRTRRVPAQRSKQALRILEVAAPLRDRPGTNPLASQDACSGSVL